MTRIAFTSASVSSYYMGNLAQCVV